MTDPMATPESLQNRIEASLSYIRSRSRRLLVALSGGVDSAVLLHLAVRALGPENVLAVTGSSASLPDHDRGDARGVAAEVGCGHAFVDTGEVGLPAYRANRGDRCFHCRDELFRVLQAHALETGHDAIAYGAIRDDESDDRPGMRAADHHGVLAPLLAAGIGKDDVRAIAAAAGLTVRDKPSAACLASRIPVGTEVTESRLTRIARAEEVLRALGFGQFRVRHHGDVARIEVDVEGASRIAEPGIRARVVRGVRAAGYRFVTLDLEPYRSGSLIPEPTSGPAYRIEPARDGGQ